jgi:hypothetical protein
MTRLPAELLQGSIDQSGGGQIAQKKVRRDAEIRAWPIP